MSDDRDFSNAYDDAARAASYDQLEYPATYHLAFRDIPELVKRHAPAQGHRALDFGCGAGRSTRFLKQLGYEACGADISAAMLELARGRDPQGLYVQVADGDLGAHVPGPFDLILSAFTFDNVPGWEKKVALLSQLRARLAPGGRLVNLLSSPDIYTHEWLSFSTKDFPENHKARTGDVVRIIMLDVPDRRPVDDVLWERADFLEVYRRAGLKRAEEHYPLGRRDEPFAWVSECEVAPWVIDVLGAAD
ncbi:MAG: class I SAM-dependent methyltransferase [bacterium]|nr:class I SAM-dependent methyltransferase [bacterium]